MHTNNNEFIVKTYFKIYKSERKIQLIQQKNWKNIATGNLQKSQIANTFQMWLTLLENEENVD